MGIQEITGKKSIQEYLDMKRTGQTEGFQESLIQNLQSQEQKGKALVGEEVKTRKSE